MNLPKVPWEKVGLFGAIGLSLYGIKSCREAEAAAGQGPLGLDKLTDLQAKIYAGIFGASLVALIAVSRRKG